MTRKSLLFILIASGLFALATPRVALAQTPAPAAQPASPDAKTPPVQNKTLMGTIVSGGWVMFPIVICSILTVYFIVDGVMRTAPKRVLPEDQVTEIKRLFQQGDYVGAYNYCRDHPSPFANVSRVAISLIGDGKEVVEEGIITELGREDSKMQTQISYLSVIGVCTPMIGLLGTVTGMIKAFQTLGASGIGDPSSLSAAIGEVLVATASGLFIAIPAFGAFYYLRNRAVNVLQRIEETIMMLFRRMPYELAQGVAIGDEQTFAAPPNWTQAQPDQETGGEGEPLPA